MRLLTGVLLVVGVVGDLPVLRPRKNTIACADPLAAQDFVLKYVGGVWTEQLVEGGDGSCATIKWVNFSPDDPANANNTQFHLHFVETSRKPTGPMSLIQLHGYAEWLHGDLNSASNPADELADQHVTFAAGSLDAFVELYRRDGVPFSARARRTTPGNATLYSILVEVPHGILFEIVSDVFENFEGLAARADDACAPRHVPTATRAYFDALRLKTPYSSERLPPVVPHSMSYASTEPEQAAAFVERYLGAAVVDQDLGADCAATIRIGLNHFDNPTYPYYVQWLHHPQARQGRLSLANIEDYLTELHGNLTEDHYDQYMDDHLGLETVVRGDESFAGFFESWRGQIDWFYRMASWDGVDSFIEAPGGVILEAMVADAKGAHFGLETVNWDICSPLPVPLPNPHTKSRR